MSLAQELIDKVVYDLIDDLESLKSCALLSSRFRVSAQRILFRTVKLKSRDPEANSPFRPGYRVTAPLGSYNYLPISLIFRRSPHIASYVARLEITLPDWNGGELLDTIRDILQTAALANVRHFHVETESRGSAEGLVNLSPTFLQFIARQPLEELGLLGLRDIPVSLFLNFLAAAPAFYVQNSHIVHENIAGTTASSPPNGRNLERLRLLVDCEEMCQLLLLPVVSAFTDQLRSLSISPDYRHNRALISSVHRTLQHITFRHPKGGTLPLPLFPELRSWEISFYPNVPVEWVTRTVSTMLRPNSSPDLSKVVFTFSTGVWYKLSFGRDLLDPLDAALAGHPNHPDLIWKLFRFNNQAINGLAELTALVQDGMPRTHASGKLVFEMFQDLRAEALGGVSG